MTNETLLLDL